MFSAIISLVIGYVAGQYPPVRDRVNNLARRARAAFSRSTT